MTVLLGVSMGAHAVRMALPRNGGGAQLLSPARVLDAPPQLFFNNQVIDTVDDDVEYLAAESISAVAAESEPTMSTGVAYRDAHQFDTLHRALEHQHLQNYQLVHEVEAVVEYLVTSGESAGYSTVALYDLGSSGLNVSVVDLAGRRVIATRRSTEFSGDEFDTILRDNQLDRLGKPLDAPDIDLFTRRCRVAKERLSGNDAVCLPDESGMILLSRDSYETLISDEVDRSIEFARDVMISAHVPIDAVVLIGGGSRIPLVRKRVGPALDLPAITPNEPESVAARGAALSVRPTDAPPTQRSTTRVVSVQSMPGTPRPTDATPTISISRDDLPVALPPLEDVQPVRVPEPSPTPEPAPAPTPTPENPPADAAPSSRHFALKNVYWLDADYEDDDGEDESVRKRRLVRTWSAVAVVAAAVVAVAGFLVTRPAENAPVVDTAVTQAPAPSAVATTPATTPAAAPPAAPVVPPAAVTTTTAAAVEPEPEVVPEETVVPQPTLTQQAPEPEPTTQAPTPTPEPPPLIPGLPGFTLPTIPPLFPPAP